MLTCKSVSKALERGDYESLPPLKKLLLKLHVRLCTMCGSYNGFVMTMQDTTRGYCEHEACNDAGCQEKLPKEAADSLKQQLREAAVSESTAG